MHFNPQLFKVSIIQTKLFGPLDFELSKFQYLEYLVRIVWTNTADPDQAAQWEASLYGPAQFCYFARTFLTYQVIHLFKF